MLSLGQSTKDEVLRTFKSFEFHDHKKFHNNTHIAGA